MLTPLRRSASLCTVLGLGAIAALAPVAIAQPAAGSSDAGAVLSSPSSAADRRDATRPTRTEPAADRAFNLSFRPRVEHTFDADLRDSNGSVAATRAGAVLGFAAPISERARVLVNAEGEFSRYEWSDASDLLPSGQDPIKDAYLFRLSPGMVYAIDSDWSLTAGGVVEIAAASGADVGDAITFGGFFGARYRWSETLTSTFGIIAKTRLEDSPIAVPLLGVQWQITERVRLENEGLGLKLSADLNEQWRAGVFARYELRDYRLATDGDGGSVPDGVLRDSRIPLGVSIEWRPSPSVQVELLGGAVVYQSYEIETKHGDRVQSDRANPTPFVGLTGTIAF